MAYKISSAKHKLTACARATSKQNIILLYYYLLVGKNDTHLMKKNFFLKSCHGTFYNVVITTAFNNETPKSVFSLLHILII